MADLVDQIPGISSDHARCRQAHGSRGQSRRIDDPRAQRHVSTVVLPVVNRISVPDYPFQEEGMMLRNRHFHHVVESLITMEILRIATVVVAVDDLPSRAVMFFIVIS